MTGFKRIFGPIFLIMFQFTVAAPEGKQSSSLIVQVGNDIALACGKNRNSPKDCASTTWTYRNYLQAKTVFKDGQFLKDATNTYKTITGSCSLAIKKVTLQDAGLYACKQLMSTNQDVEDSVIDLSVIRMCEQEYSGEVCLQCSLQEQNYCTHTVEWVYEQKIPSDVRILSEPCLATATFTRSPFNQKSNIYELLKCKVTTEGTGEVQLFTFRPQPSKEEDEKKDAATATQLHTTTLPTTRKCIIYKATKTGTTDLPLESRNGVSMEVF